MQQSGSVACHRSAFGALALAAFLLVQVCDGVLTYLAVTTYGVQMEGNPLLVWLMVWLGRGPALAITKTAASGFGVALHLTSVHRIVAALTLFYLALAILPWLGILYSGCRGC